MDVARVEGGYQRRGDITEPPELWLGSQAGRIEPGSGATVNPADLLLEVVELAKRPLMSRAQAEGGGGGTE